MEAPVVVLSPSSLSSTSRLRLEAPSLSNSPSVSVASSTQSRDIETPEPLSRPSTDTGIASIYSMYGTVDRYSRGSWAMKPAPQLQFLPDDDLVEEDTELAYYRPSSKDRPPSSFHLPSMPERPHSTTSASARPRSSVLTVGEDATRRASVGSQRANARTSDLSDFKSTVTHITSSEESSNSSRAMSEVPSVRLVHSRPPSSHTPPLPPPTPPKHGLLAPSTPPKAGPSSPPRRGSPTATAASDHSVLSREEGEDPDAFHVRNTYAQLEMSGVKGDGYVEGVERTRARVGKNRASQLEAELALGDATEKTRDLKSEEIQTLATVDRYGFLSLPSHDRLVLLASAPLSKRLSRISAGPPSYPPSPRALSKLPAASAPAKETSRISKWNRMLQPRSRDQGSNIQLWEIKPQKKRKLRERTYKGIPDRWRNAAWGYSLSSISPSESWDLDRLGRDYREALDKPSTYDIQIDLDVPRTISGHIMFKTRYGAGQRSLFHVLHSFSQRCPECGYVQGMGPITATLLCYYDPERTYATLVRLHDSKAYNLHSIFSPGFPGLLEAIYVQERLMENLLPDVYQAFKKHMVTTTSYATKWYITLFANTVPFQTQLRIWDAFFLEGQDVFVAVALAIVWAYRDHLTSTQANFETVLSMLSSFFVPEDEDVLMRWIDGMLGDKKVRDDMARWRRDWHGLVAAGKDGDALL